MKWHNWSVKGADRSFRPSSVSWLVSEYVPLYENLEAEFSAGYLGCRSQESWWSQLIRVHTHLMLQKWTWLTVLACLVLVTNIHGDPWRVWITSSLSWTQMLTVSLESFLFLSMRTLRSVFRLALPIPRMPSYFPLLHQAETCGCHDSE